MEEAQIASNRFVRALMTSVCQSVLTCKYDSQPQSSGRILHLIFFFFSSDRCSVGRLTNDFALCLVSDGDRYELDAEQFQMRVSLLQKYLCDEQKELQALYALQALMVEIDHPTSTCLKSSFSGLVIL